MSGSGSVPDSSANSTPSVPDSTLIQQDGAIPETVVPAEETPEAPVESAEAAEKAEETPAEPVKPKRTPWYQDRINELTRRAKAAEEKLASAKQPATEEPDQAAAFKPEQFEQLIDQRAQALVAQREFNNRSKAWIEAGNKEFGASDFMEKCNEVAALGAGDSAEFMSLITDADIIPDGHKVIAALADNPEETQRILSLDPVRMAAALTKFATTAKLPEKKISQAPAPIKSIGGTAKASAPSDDEPIQSWMAKRRAEVAAKGKH